MGKVLLLIAYVCERTRACAITAYKENCLFTTTVRNRTAGAGRL